MTHGFSVHSNATFCLCPSCTASSVGTGVKLMRPVSMSCKCWMEQTKPHLTSSSVNLHISLCEFNEKEITVNK
jgi:hypothetical protein